MTDTAENDAGNYPAPDATDVPCPACGAAVDEPCTIRLSGVDTTGWSHDARILAPVYADLRTLRSRPIPPADGGGHHPRCTGQHETIMGETACVLPPGVTEETK